MEVRQVYHEKWGQRRKLSWIRPHGMRDSSLMSFAGACHLFVAASHQTRLDTRSKARRPVKVGIKGRGRSGRSRDSNPACLCCSSAHLVQCEPDEASGFTNPNVGPGTYASLRLKLDAWSSAVQRGQKVQLAHPKVAQPKLGAYSAPSLLFVSSTPSGTNARRPS